MRKLVAFLLGAVAALAIGACGDDEKKATTEQAQPSGQTITVRETEFALDPANPRIDRPGTIEFNVQNDGKTVHALEVEGPGGESKTGDIQPGESATLTADLGEPGTYEWYCPVGNHRDLGMEGEIQVGGGGGTGTNTTTTGTTETNTTETNTTETNTTETEPGDDSGGGSGGSGSGGSGSGGSGY